MTAEHALKLKLRRTNAAVTRKRALLVRSVRHPTRPQNITSRTFATATAIVREVTYPQVLFLKGRWLGWLSPPPLGRSLLLLSYWAVIVTLLTTGSIIDDAYYWERIGFRGAWVSVTQVPLVYLLASKVNIIAYLCGTSYERLNWLHRWVSRTLLITVTVHGSFFFAEWVRADFVQLELEMMPMVKYGLGAWGVLLWTVFSSLVPIRRVAYEFFVLQHIVAAAVILWLLYMHVPSYAVYNIWLSIGVLVFDRIARVFWTLYQNIALRGAHIRQTSTWIGYNAKIRAVGKDITVVSLQNVSFTWKAGQHFYLWLPGMGFPESHPFTVSSVPSNSKDRSNNNVEFVIRAHSGFTRRLYQRAVKTVDNESIAMRAIVTGPFGNMPTWNAFETLVLIAAGTGASFTLPILEIVLHEPSCVQRLDFLFLVKTASDADCYTERLQQAIGLVGSSGISLRVRIAVTEASRIYDDNSTEALSFKEESASIEKSASFIEYSQGRPNLAEFIRYPIEKSGGETSVAVCGGKELVATVSNCVASLSDERAVHKGTGAQGIHLHVEEYCF